MKHFCENENCDNEMVGEVVGFRLYNDTIMYFCDEDCLQDWIKENKVYKFIYTNGEME